MTLQDKKKCDTCGRTFKPTRSDQRFDSPKCKKQAERKRANRRGPDARPSHNPTRRLSTLQGYLAALTTAREAARAKPSDLAEKELTRLVTLVLDEMKSLGLTRRQKQKQIRSQDIPSVTELVSNREVVLENMSPAAIKAHRLRERLALEKYSLRLAALGMKPDFGHGGMVSDPSADLEGIEPFIENFPGPVRKDLRQLVAAGYETVGFDHDQLPLLVQLAIEEVSQEALIGKAIAGTANSYRLQAAKLRCRRLENALGLDGESVNQNEWVSPEEAIILAFVTDCEREVNANESAEDARSALSSTASLYEAGILDGPVLLEVQKEITRRNTPNASETPTLSEVIRHADTPF